MAAVYTTNGNELCTGLQGCRTCDEAIQAAERCADDLGEDVQLNDDDGIWLVHPALPNGRREKADPLGSFEEDEE